MIYFFAAFPILVVIASMLLARWGGQRAGPLGWLAGCLLAIGFFGLTPSVFAVSQIKGIQLSLFVLAIIWPALLLYYLVENQGGIHAVPGTLASYIADHDFVALLLAWSFSGMLEGLAGFGLPIAVVAPMLVALRVEPVRAVAAVAAGHAWAVTFGDMGVIFQTLVSVVNLPEQTLVPASAFLLGLACLACGTAAAMILGAIRFWREILVIGVVAGLVQFGLAKAGLLPLSAFGAGLAGLLTGVGCFHFRQGSNRLGRMRPAVRESLPALTYAIFSYGSLTGMMMVIYLAPQIRSYAGKLIWQSQYPGVMTRTGFLTPAGQSVAFRPFTHPGTLLFLAVLLTLWRCRRRGNMRREDFQDVWKRTWTSALPASLTILSMVCLATLMEHCGMTWMLAKGLSNGLGLLFPLVSPLVGILGAFATGSNNNSNVLFAPLQKAAAGLLGISPFFLVASQTAGGALGSLLAPAKLILGCATAGIMGRDGAVLKLTLPWGLGIGLLLGMVTWILTYWR